LEVALDARADLRVHVALCRANPFEVDGDVLLNHLGYEDFEGRWGSSGFGAGLALTSSDDNNGDDDEQRVKSWPDLLANPRA